MLKKLFTTLTLCICLAIGTATAQFSRPISIGLGAGSTYNITDLANVKPRFAAYGEADYLFSPFISVGLRGEKGQLSGEGYLSEFKNSYYAGNINAKVRMGQFMSLTDNYSYYTLGASNLQRILSNVYIGAGAGVMLNRITRTITKDYNKLVENKGGEISKNVDGAHFVIPINIGVDIPFGRTLYGPKWAVNVNYQHTLTTDDNLDGVILGSKDQYGLLSVGVKYALFNRN